MKNNNPALEKFQSAFHVVIDLTNPGYVENTLDLYKRWLTELNDAKKNPGPASTKVIDTLDPILDKQMNLTGSPKLINDVQVAYALYKKGATTLDSIIKGIPDIKQQAMEERKAELEAEKANLITLGRDAAIELAPAIYEEGMQFFTGNAKAILPKMEELVWEKISGPLGLQLDKTNDTFDRTKSNELAKTIHDTLMDRHNNKTPKEGIAGIVDAIRQFIDDLCSKTLVLSHSKSARKETSEKIGIHVEAVLRERYAPDSQDKGRS